MFGIESNYTVISLSFLYNVKAPNNLSFFIHKDFIAIFVFHYIIAKSKFLIILSIAKVVKQDRIASLVRLDNQHNFAQLVDTLRLHRDISILFL